MQSDGTERKVSENMQPLLQAFRYLAPYAPRIAAAWSKTMERNEPCRQHAQALASLHLAHRGRELGSIPSRAYRDAAERQGADLARRSVPPECAVVAISLYLECCLRYLMSPDARTHRWRSELVRWASAYQFSLLSGYTRHTAEERQGWKEKTALAEKRSQALAVELGEAYEKERRRLAQDLHDEIGHDLIVLKLYMQIIALDLKKGDVRPLRGKLKEAVSLIDHALKGVRHLVFDLGPAVWNEQGFIPAVRLYARQFAARTELKVRFTTRRLTQPLPPRYESAMYKVLQGALSNVAAHAGARNVAIALTNRRDSVVMSVEDDGKGFDVGRKLKNLPRSYGLRAMRDRIELLGGNIDFTSMPTRRGAARAGTRVELHLPMNLADTK
jgi:signal transduction histidine kinase